MPILGSVRGSVQVIDPIAVIHRAIARFDRAKARRNAMLYRSRQIARMRPEESAEFDDTVLGDATDAVWSTYLAASRAILASGRVAVVTNGLLYVASLDSDYDSNEDPLNFGVRGISGAILDLDNEARS